MKQRGSILLYCLLALGVTTFAGGMVWTWKSAISRAETAEAAERTARERLDEALGENSQLRLLKAQQDKILAERRRKQVTSDEIERMVGNALSSLLANPQVRDWATQPVPPAVLDSLRERPAASSPPDGKAPPLAKPISNIPNSRLRGSKDKLGLAGACSETPGACAFLSARQGGYQCLVPGG